MPRLLVISQGRRSGPLEIELVIPTQYVPCRNCTPVYCSYFTAEKGGVASANQQQFSAENVILARALYQPAAIRNQPENGFSRIHQVTK